MANNNNNNQLPTIQSPMLDLKHPPPLPPTNASEQMKMPNDYMEYEYDGYVPPPSPLIEYGPPPSPLIEYGPPPPPPVEYNHEGHPTYTDPLLSLPWKPVNYTDTQYGYNDQENCILFSNYLSQLDESWGSDPSLLIITFVFFPKAPLLNLQLFHR